MNDPVPVATSVSVGELQRAWSAVRRGAFRSDVPATHPVGGDWSVTELGRGEWSPGERESVVAVVGCRRSVGTTTLAVGLATLASAMDAEASRVVELAAPTQSGLVAAGVVELGPSTDGWRTSRREGVVLQRRCDPRAGLLPPSFEEAGGAVTVLDVGELNHAALGAPWLARCLTDGPVVAVTDATVPGMRGLESALALLSELHRHRSETKNPADGSSPATSPDASPVALGPARVVVAVVGPPRRRWSRELAYSGGHRTRTLLEESTHVRVIPEDRGLHVRGLDVAPLPPSLLVAARAVMRDVLETYEQRTSDGSPRAHDAEHPTHEEEQR